MKPSGRLLGSVALVAMAIGCNADQPSGLDGSRRSVMFDALAASEAPLVEHIVAPQATDPAIDRFLDNHYVWLDTSARANHELLVFMPGTGQVPAMFQLVQQEAARLGYHVIGLSYLNSGGFAKVCPIAPDPASCYEGSRLEVIDGIDRSPFVNVNPANSIDNRLTKLLEFLGAQYPDEGWTQFLAAGEPNWRLIAVSGLSQGGGEAVMIGRIRLVARVVMFSSLTDSLLGGGSVPWVGARHVTPVNRYWGLAHDRDAFFPAILAAWDSIGLAAFGPAAIVESGDPPYGWTHMLVTDLTPHGGLVGPNAHVSPATDAFTPLAPDGTPLLRDAWDYSLTGLPRRPGRGEQVARHAAGDASVTTR